VDLEEAASTIDGGTCALILLVGFILLVGHISSWS
jgi:hypothetical protein